MSQNYRSVSNARSQASFQPLMAEEPIDRSRHVVTPPPATTMAAELDVARFYQRLGAIHSAFAKHRCVGFSCMT